MTDDWEQADNVVPESKFKDEDKPEEKKGPKVGPLNTDAAAPATESVEEEEL